jgi:hypothetical protein
MKAPPSMGAARPTPTRPDDAMDARRARRARNGRRVGIALLVLIVIAALSGILGQRTRTVTTTGGGYSLAVTYPAVVRPGVDVRWEVRIEKPGGLGDSLTIAMDRHYFDDFDLNSLRPDADASVSNGDQVIYSWNALPGDTFQLSLDALAENGEHFGVWGSTAILVKGSPVATVRYHTRWEP